MATLHEKHEKQDKAKKPEKETQQKETQQKELQSSGAPPAHDTPVPFRGGTLAPSFGREPWRWMRDEFDRMVDQVFHGWPAPWEGGANRTWRWGLDVRDENGFIVVRAEAPGFESKDFELEVRGDQLVLHAVHKTESGEKEQDVHEWQQREFYRAVSLPADIDPEKVEAHYRNGVLTVKMPKTAQSKGRHITVQG